MKTTYGQEIGEVSFDVASCTRCDPLRSSRLVVRVPAPDLALLRPGRVALSCRACGARFVRPNGT